MFILLLDDCRRLFCQSIIPNVVFKQIMNPEYKIVESDVDRRWQRCRSKAVGPLTSCYLGRVALSALKPPSTIAATGHHQHPFPSDKFFHNYSHDGSVFCRGRLVSRIPTQLIQCANLFLPAELLNIHNAFHSGQYQDVIDFETSALSPENQVPARALKLRAQIALGQYDEALADPSIEEDSPDLTAVKALALQSSGKTDDALQLAQELAENYPDNNTVQVLAATVLQAQGLSEEALALLAKHQGNLEA